MAGLAVFSALGAKNNHPTPTGPSLDQNPSGIIDFNEDIGGVSDTKPDDSKYDEILQQEVALRQPEERYKLSCDDVACYSGAYVEDRSDEQVNSVAAIRITNRSGKYLTLARLTYEIDGETAEFEISDLPAGKSVWVLEKNRKKSTDSSKYVYKEALVAFSDYVTRMPEEIKVEYGENMLRVTNVSQKEMQRVSIHYKSIHEDGRLLGGITYTVDFGTLQPGESVEKIAGHYDNEWTLIVRVVCEEATNEAP